MSGQEYFVQVQRRATSPSYALLLVSRPLMAPDLRDVFATASRGRDQLPAYEQP
jgi:hypothetical protein